MTKMPFINLKKKLLKCYFMNSKPHMKIVFMSTGVILSGVPDSQRYP